MQNGDNLRIWSDVRRHECIQSGEDGITRRSDISAVHYLADTSVAIETEGNRVWFGASGIRLLLLQRRRNRLLVLRVERREVVS